MRQLNTATAITSLPFLLVFSSMRVADRCFTCTNVCKRAVRVELRWLSYCTKFPMVLNIWLIQQFVAYFRVEIEGLWGSVSSLSAGEYTTTLYVMVYILKGGVWSCNPHPHQLGLIFPSWWNVRRKVCVATLWLVAFYEMIYWKYEHWTQCINQFS